MGDIVWLSSCGAIGQVVGDSKNVHYNNCMLWLVLEALITAV
jgi:hypothetical protein